MNFILKIKLKSIFETVTKETGSALKIAIIGFIFSTAMMATKYKPAYEVKVNNEILGYIEDEESFRNKIEEQIINKKGQNIESVSIPKEPEYELKLISREKEINEDEVISKLNDTAVTTYKYYAVTLNNKTKAYVDTLEEAEEVVKEIKSEYKNSDLDFDLVLSEKYTQKQEEVKTEKKEKIELSLEEEIEELLEKEEAKKAIATVNGINLSVLPVSGRISSRFGALSSLRSGAHTGLDIACDKGTPIKVVAKGKVIFAEKNGAYGNLIKVDHGDGVETWYAHCDKIIADVGDEVKPGDIIGQVGTTGNSTGPHLHLEIRIDGTAINPQKYLYK